MNDDVLAKILAGAVPQHYSRFEDPRKYFGGGGGTGLGNIKGSRMQGANAKPKPPTYDTSNLGKLSTSALNRERLRIAEIESRLIKEGRIGTKESRNANKYSKAIYDELAARKQALQAAQRETKVWRRTTQTSTGN